jgi:hypothetical protein
MSNFVSSFVFFVFFVIIIRKTERKLVRKISFIISNIKPSRAMKVINILYFLLIIYRSHTGQNIYFNIDIIYLLLLLTMVLLLLSVPPGIRRLKIICPRRISKGGFVADDDDTGEVVVISSRAAELRRRL